MLTNISEKAYVSKLESLVEKNAVQSKCLGLISNQIATRKAFETGIILIFNHILEQLSGIFKKYNLKIP